MLIFSQDRTFVLNFDNVATLDAGIPERPNQLVATFPTGTGLTLGKFKDDDRLKEVLDEFRKAYFDGKPTFYVPKD